MGDRRLNMQVTRGLEGAGERSDRVDRGTEKVGVCREVLSKDSRERKGRPKW